MERLFDLEGNEDVVLNQMGMKRLSNDCLFVQYQRGGGARVKSSISISKGVVN